MAVNAENLLVIRDPKLAARYLSNWGEHRAHSEGYGFLGWPRSPDQLCRPLDLLDHCTASRLR